MGTYKHILVATNLSEDSRQVADRARLIANASKAKLSMVHVIEFNPMMYSGGEFAVPLNGDIEESLHEHAAQALEAEGKRLKIPKEDQYLQSGITVDHLAETVTKLNIDLLVLGHHEHNWLTSVLGSTSNSILHLMPCDVIAVHLKHSE